MPTTIVREPHGAPFDHGPALRSIRALPRIAATSDRSPHPCAARASIRATGEGQPPACRLLQLVVMVIPHRDWLLLRGRMRAVAKISVLPLLLQPTCVAESDDRDEDQPDAADDERDA